jgi:hypothetical protein
MKQIYFKAENTFRASLLFGFLVLILNVSAQQPTTPGPGTCTGITANFNTNDQGFNSPSIYAGMFDSAFYYNAGRGYWTEYAANRTTAPGVPRVIDIISPPYNNPNPVGTFDVGFYYIVPNALVGGDRFQVRIISVTNTAQGTITNTEAVSGVQYFANWSTPTVYTETAVPLIAGFEGRVCIRLYDVDITNAPNTTYRVEVAYLVNEPFFTVFDDLSIGTQQIPLPVNFIGLVATRDNNLVSLKWDVSEEINVQQYEVERSANGSSFNTVGVVPSKGKSIYSFTDASAGSGNIFYRVKSKDIDGKFKYSGIILLHGSGNSFSNTLNIYPSPAKSQATVGHKLLTANARITITTLDGKVVNVIRPTVGSSHTPVDLTAIPSGIYILRLDDGKGTVETTKFVKQ